MKTATIRFTHARAVVCNNLVGSVGSMAFFGCANPTRRGGYSGQLSRLRSSDRQRNQITHLCDALFFNRRGWWRSDRHQIIQSTSNCIGPERCIESGEIQLFAHLVDLAIQLAQRRQQLIAESLLDPLTGLLNRRGWDAYFESQQAVSGVIAFLDIDDFKGLNLEIGYQSADDRLARFGRILRDSVRATDCVCRWGGDEFVIFFSDANEDGVRSRLQDVSRHSEAVIGRSFSFGVVDLLRDRIERGAWSQAIRPCSAGDAKRESVEGRVRRPSGVGCNESGATIVDRLRTFCRYPPQQFPARR